MSHHRTETQLILGRRTERAHHRVLRVAVAKRKAIDLAQPEEKTADVRVAPQITRILREHKRAVVFRIDELPVIDRVLRVVIAEPVQHSATPGVVIAALIVLID